MKVVGRVHQKKTAQDLKRDFRKRKIISALSLFAIVFVAFSLVDADFSKPFIDILKQEGIAFIMSIPVFFAELSGLEPANMEWSELTTDPKYSILSGNISSED